jgi:protein tyrosine/serine phosphatase
VLLRSDNLQDLTARDVSLLIDEVGLSRVVDLRTAEEVELEGPGPLVGRVPISHRDLWPESGRLTDIMISRAEGENPAVQFYLGYLRDRPDSIVGALHDIASADGAVIVHCAAGKDRTGVVVGLALAAAGVPMDAILADYMATAERIIAVSQRMLSSETYRADLENVPREKRMPRADTLERVFASLDGGPLGWLSSQGFDVEPLRRRLRL